MTSRPKLSLALLGMLSIFLFPSLNSQEVLSPHELVELKSCGNLQLSPDAKKLIYSVSTARGPNEAKGGSRAEYFIMDLEDNSSEHLFEPGVTVSSVQWSPDGISISFLHASNGKPGQVWSMPAGGGDMTEITSAESSVSSYRWRPDGKGLAYLAATPETEREKELEKRGYGFIFYEENLKNTNLFLTEVNPDRTAGSTKQLTEDVQVWDFEFNNQGTKIAAGISPKNLVDHRYMFKRIHLIDVQTGSRDQISKNEGKLGNYFFSPDDKFLAYTAALNINDHAVSQVYIADTETGSVKNLTPEKFPGHISWANWKSNKEILYLTGEGVYPKLSLVSIKGGDREVILDAEESGIIFSSPGFSPDFKNFVFTASTVSDAGNIYYWKGKGEPERLTDLNPVLKNRALGKQERIRYNARDGQQIEGILMYPVSHVEGNKYPLIVYVHGGPESHHNNGWLSRYSTPGQVMAGKGYMVLYLNYRASTGYGVDFGMKGFEDPAGVEFDDIADGIEFLIKEKGADPDRVGLAGGSYGGYASGWFATYYTDYVKAVCMFVGISDLVSKRGTTDIAYEELYVHSGKKLEEQWQLSLERSPIYWAHQSKTATLIYGGAADTRVHPSQSMELYRRMKMNDHPAVRLVQYPGEGHGNRNQTGRLDVILRQLDWLDWYVKDLKPLDGPMPPLDISDKYGLDWDF